MKLLRECTRALGLFTLLIVFLILATPVGLVLFVLEQAGLLHLEPNVPEWVTQPLPHPENASLGRPAPLERAGARKFL